MEVHRGGHREGARIHAWSFVIFSPISSWLNLRVPEMMIWGYKGFLCCWASDLISGELVCLHSNCSCPASLGFCFLYFTLYTKPYIVHHIYHITYPISHIACQRYCSVYSISHILHHTYHISYHIDHTTILYISHHTHCLSYNTPHHICTVPRGFCFRVDFCLTTFCVLCFLPAFRPFPLLLTLLGAHLDAYSCRPPTGHSFPFSPAYSSILGVDVSLTGCDMTNYNFLLR